MIACETQAQAEAILQALGSMMLALAKQMPELGWRMLADALASIQIALLSDESAASELAQDTTQQLFASLRHALPQERYQAILAHSGQVVEQVVRPTGLVDPQVEVRPATNQVDDVLQEIRIRTDKSEIGRAHV